MVFGQLTVALRSGGTMSPLPVSAFRIEHIVTVQPDEGLRIGVEGIPQRFVIHYFNIINYNRLVAVYFRFLDGRLHRTSVNK